MKLTTIAIGWLFAIGVACVSFELESRRFRCAGQPDICDTGWTCGADGYCAPLGDGGQGPADTRSNDGATGEVCNNGLDDDGDGQVDCADAECPGTTTCGQGCYCIAGQPRELACTDGMDNDKDTTTDCRDSDCPSCSGQNMCCPDGVCRASC